MRLCSGTRSTTTRARDAQFLDVRSREEFGRGSLPGAHNIPIDELRERVGELGPSEIVVYCEVGQRGHVATTLLNQLGYRAQNLDGGFRTWHCSPAAADTPARWLSPGITEATKEEGDTDVPQGNV